MQASLELGCLGVLVLVDHVLVDALGHEDPGLRLHPGRDEGRQVEPGAAVEQQLVVDQLVGDCGRDGVRGEPAARQLEPLAQHRIGLRRYRIRAEAGRWERRRAAMQSHARDSMPEGHRRAG
jgi:hypothetical protein